MLAILTRHRGFVALGILAIVVLFLLTRTAWFWHDEWYFMRTRSFTDPASWFLPYVEHFIVLHAAIYSALVAIFGTSTYLPYLAVLFATHIAFVAAIYVLVDRHVGRGPALATTGILLFLGSAALNMFWAFQMGPVGAGALAMWGLVVIRQRPGLTAILMGLGAATAGFALFVIPAAALYGWSRRALLASAVPVAVYGTWYVLIARGMIAPHGTAPTVSGVLDWVSGGIVASTNALTGLGPLGLLLLIVATGLLLRVPDPSLAAVGLAALLTEYVILGLSRPGLNTPAGWQYVYFGAAFVALVFASAWPAVPRLARPAVALLTAVALAANVLALVDWSIGYAALQAGYDTFCSRC